jgi:hypothetical protein
MGWNNMEPFSIPGNEACQNERVAQPTHRDCPWESVRSAFRSRTELLSQIPTYKREIQWALRFRLYFLISQSVELINSRVIYWNSITGRFHLPQNWLRIPKLPAFMVSLHVTRYHKMNGLTECILDYTLQITTHEFLVV